MRVARFPGWRSFESRTSPSSKTHRASQSRIGLSPVSSDEEFLVHANMGRTCCPEMLFSRLSWEASLAVGAPRPEDVISAREADLVGNADCDPISAVGGPRHQGASRRVALIPQSSQGTPRSVQDENSWPEAQGPTPAFEPCVGCGTQPTPSQPIRRVRARQS